jgi:hypothetical protein
MGKIRACDLPPLRYRCGVGHSLLEAMMKTIETTLSKEDEAFIEAYANNVANAPEDVVREYLAVNNHTEFYEKHWEYYGSIADAHGMWHAALSYAKELK